MQMSVSDFNGVNTFTNPFNTQDGNVIHCLNLSSDTNGSKVKRPGYTTFLGTADGKEVNSLFSWTKDDGTSLYVYRASGANLWYSAQGTGAWTVAGGGTIANGAHVGYAVLDNTLVVGDGSGTPMSSTDGINFSPIAAAPVGAQWFSEFQGRIYSTGTASYIFYSTTGTATDWTTDSSSLLIGGAGKVGNIFKASDRLVTTKTSGLLHRWDGEELVDLATELGPSSPYSIGNVEDMRFWLNRLGVFASNANKPQLISNPIQRQIYNNIDSGIADAVFDTAPAGVQGYNYMIAVGTVKDNFTDITIPKAVLVYNYKQNEFFNYEFYNEPTAFHQFKDANQKQQFIFGDASGQVYQLDNDATADNGYPIETNMVFLLHGNMPHIRKDFGYIEFFTSPGCQANVQFAVEDIVVTGDKRISGPKKWKDLGSLIKGYTLFRFPPETRGRLLYIRIYESSTTRPYEFYSCNYTFEPLPL